MRAGCVRSAGSVLLFLLLVCPVGALTAQTVEGVVVDGRNGLPVPGAFLTLIADDDVVHDTITSDRRGQFTLRAGAAGLYMIGTERVAYASMLSDGIALDAGITVSYRLEVPPLSLKNMQQIAETLDRNQRLQRGVGELCRGRMNPVEGGILLGVVRDGRTREPVSGAIARFRLTDGGEAGEVFTAVTDRYGTYLFCFVPKGDDVGVSVRAPGYRPSSQEVEIRPGTISWYDFRLRSGGGDPDHLPKRTFPESGALIG